MKKSGLIFFIIFSLVILAQAFYWLFANSAEPIILGMPFGMFFIVFLIAIDFFALQILYYIEKKGSNIIAWTLGLYLVYSLYGGPAEMFRQIIKTKPMHLLVGPGTSISFLEYSSSFLVSVLGFAMWPQLFMKAFSAESEKVIIDKEHANKYIDL